MGFLKKNLLKAVEKQVDVEELVFKFLEWLDGQIDDVDEGDDNDLAEKARDYLRSHFFHAVRRYEGHVEGSDAVEHSDR